VQVRSAPFLPRNTILGERARAPDPIQMKRALLCSCLGWMSVQAAPGRSAVDAQAAAAPPVFLELTSPRATYFVHEPIPVRFRFGCEQGFLQGSMVQMFPQQLDVPVQLVAPWIEELPGAIALEEPAALEPAGRGGERLRFALNDGLAAARRVEDVAIAGRSYTVLELERSYLATSAGALELPETQLRFAYATTFEQDFLQGRTPLDRRDASVSGAGLELSIQPLPEEGRPLEFTGAVGRFSVRAEAEPRDLELGQSLKLTFCIEGQGNLAFFPAPRLDGLRGLRALGSIDAPGAGRRCITYDLAPASADVSEVPPIPFAYFDPGPPAAYHAVATAAIPILVRPRAERARAEDGVESVNEERGRERSSALVMSVVVVAGLVVAGLVLGMRARRKTRDVGAPQRARARVAASAFHEHSSGPDGNTAQALAEFLAAHLGCPTAALFAPRLGARLAAAGLPPELAARTAAAFQRLVAARYGKSAHEVSAEETRALIEELERAFAGIERD